MLEISGAISGVTATMQALKAAVSARDEAKINAAISDLKDRLFEVQTANLQIVEKLHQAQTRIHDLVEEVAGLKAAQRERDLYVPHNMAERGYGDFWAYRQKDSSLDGDAGRSTQHYLCQTCFDGGKKSFLVHNGSGYWSCNLCGKGHQVRDDGVDLGGGGRIPFGGW